MASDKFSLDEWGKFDDVDKYDPVILERVAFLVEQLEDDQIIAFLNNNLLVARYVSDDIQRKFVAENIYNLKFTSSSFQNNMVLKDVRNLFYCSVDIQCMFVKDNPNLYGYCNVEVKRDLIVLKLLDPNKITIETLDSYLSMKYDDLSLSELRSYADEISKTSRSDKSELINYINYLVVNIEKKKAFFEN